MVRFGRKPYGEKRVKKSLLSLIFCTIVLFVVSFPLSAQQGEPVQPPASEKPAAPEAGPQYALGDQTFAVTLGAFVPLFNLSWQPAVFPTGLTLGGLGFLQWQAYVTPSIRVGADLGGMFSFDRNLMPLFELQLVGKASYVFSLYPLEIPVSLGLGATLVSYQGNTTFDPIIKPGVSVFWVFNSSWSFGLNVVYWWDMMFSSVSDRSRVGNFLEISLSALYHF